MTFRNGLIKLTSALLALAAATACSHQATPSSNAAVASVTTAQAAGSLALLVMPNMGVTPILQAIQAAKKSILLEIYMVTDHDESAQVVDALAERAKAGVHVQVIMEGRPYLPPSGATCAPPLENPNLAAIRVLQTAGVNVQYGNPRFKFTHEKAMVIDGATAYIMTMNLTNSAFQNNRDYAIVDGNPGDVAAVSAIFKADWQGRPITPSDTHLVVSPDNSRLKLLGLIDSAHKSLVIESEFLSDPEIAAHLKSRVAAGVDVTVMLSFQEPSPCVPGDVNADETKLLAEMGVTKFGFAQKLRMHAKIIVADAARAFVGSENLTANSLDNNRELGILLNDPGIVSQLQQTALADFAQQ